MSLDELKQQRASTKKNITRIKNIVDASLRQGGKILSAAEYKCRLGILESYFKQILSIQTDIERLDSEDGGRADLEDLYITTKLVIQSQLAEDNNVSLSDITCVVQSSSKLPRLKLPTFDDKYSNYQNFITSFKQIIDREFNLANIEKFKSWEDCTKVLERHCQYLESLYNTHTNSSSVQGTSKSTSKSRSQPKSYAFSCSSTACQFCSSTGHKVSNCERFKSLNVTQRFDNTKRMALCINCLSKGHQVAYCPSTHRCKVCARQHIVYFIALLRQAKKQ